MVDGDIGQLTERSRRSIGILAERDPAILDAAGGQ
jgi:hypothetical protein